MWIRPLADADDACGAKAQNLARLIAAGLPVPGGFVVGGDADEALRDEVRAQAAALGERLAVRSSALIEDRPGGAAAGVFESRTDVAPDDVWGAIDAVRASARAPLAAAYGRHVHHEASGIAVIVQRFEPGARVTAYTRPPGAPRGESLWIQRGEALARVPRESGERIAQLARAAEAAIGAANGADVELVDAPGGPWLVQARPIVHPVRPAARRAPPPIVLAPLVADGRRWAWDVAHNPDPLSVAQAELVERVDRARVAPYALRVVVGYLYSAPLDEAPAPPAVPRDFAAAVAALEARCSDALGADRELPLDDAIARYLAFYAIWSRELAPLIAAARRAALAHLSDRERARAIGPRPIPRAPFAAPAWDVAAQTFAERGIAIPAAPPHDAAPSADPHVRLARAAADAAERDDLLFARAQWLVRRALLARAHALALRDPDDVFWIPLTDSPDADDAHRLAAANRAAAARAAAWDMPLVVNGAPPTAALPPLHGHGTGPRVRGRVVRYASLATASPAPRGSVVVARAITPALALLVAEAAALVSETGGLLDHGAALAREFGIACVVGCADAWSLLADGAIVTVDGDAGTVTLEES